MQTFSSLLYNDSQSYDTMDTFNGDNSMAEESLLHKNLHIIEKPQASRSNFSDSISCTPSLSSSQVRRRQTHSSSSQPRTAADRGSIHEAPACIQKNFDLPSANSIVHKLANPCTSGVVAGVANETSYDEGNTMERSRYSRFRDQSQIPASTPTSSSSSSGESEEETDSDDQESEVFDKRSTGRRRSGQVEGQAAASISSSRGNDYYGLRSPPPSGCDITFLVGDQQYLLSSTSTGLTSKLLGHDRRIGSDKQVVVDFSSHSPQEFQYVLEFLRPSTDSRDRVYWHNLPIVLPWFVELELTPLIKEVDMFLLQNCAGVRNDGTTQPISLSNMLKVAKIAYCCGLETTQLQARRSLRQRLLRPRKQNKNSTDSSATEEEEDVELEWSLKNLQDLADLMAYFDDCREYLWEYAVITYLPHDLDISDSMTLVCNSLFPYLLREGMMQMVIMESLEAAASTSNSEVASASSNRKTNKSFSDFTISSDTTIPTATSLPVLTLPEKEIERHLNRTIQHLERFQVEKDMREADTGSEDSSTFVHERNVKGSQARSGRKKGKSSSMASKTPRRPRKSQTPMTFTC